MPPLLALHYERVGLYLLQIRPAGGINMEHPMRKRESLEDRWLDRARIALQRYREAKAVTRAAEANHSDSTLPMADGSLAFRQALEVETVWR
jgi:hypothetical protein